MAEKERLTNKERRELAREERKRKEAEARKKAKRNQLKGFGITAVIVALVGFTVFQAVSGGPVDLDDAILVSSEEAEEARGAAGCEMLTEREPLPDVYHFPSASQPEADAIYTDTRPTHSGPHNERQVGMPPDDGYGSQIDERATTHNLEHGAVIVWYDPEQAGEQEGDIRSWAELLNANGFNEPTPGAGAAVITAPYEDPGIATGQAVAFRAWGTAMDCDTFDETVANAFVAEHFGTRGIAPESAFGRYPDGVLEFSDLEVEETERDEPEPPLLDEGELEDEVGEDAIEDGDDTIGDPAEPDADDEG